MVQRLSVSRVIFLIIACLILIAVVLVCFIPFWHVLMASISNPTNLTVNRGLVLAPLGNMDFQAYKIIGNYQKLWVGYRNTILYIVGQCGCRKASVQSGNEYKIKL